MNSLWLRIEQSGADTGRATLWDKAFPAQDAAPIVQGPFSLRPLTDASPGGGPPVWQKMLDAIRTPNTTAVDVLHAGETLAALLLDAGVLDEWSRQRAGVLDETSGKRTPVRTYLEIVDPPNAAFRLE